MSKGQVEFLIPRAHAAILIFEGIERLARVNGDDVSVNYLEIMRPSWVIGHLKLHSDTILSFTEHLITKTKGRF